MSDVRVVGERLHNRQFVVGRALHRIGGDWKSLTLSNGWTLSYCPNLRVRTCAGRDGRTIVLIGHAFQADPARPPVEEVLRGARGEDFVDESYTWAGRWVLIRDDTVVGDFSNSLGVFYCRDHGEMLISSSLALIDRISPGRRLVRRPIG